MSQFVDCDVTMVSQTGDLYLVLHANTKMLRSFRHLLAFRTSARFFNTTRLPLQEAARTPAQPSAILTESGVEHPDSAMPSGMQRVTAAQQRAMQREAIHQEYRRLGLAKYEDQAPPSFLDSIGTFFDRIKLAFGRAATTTSNVAHVVKDAAMDMKDAAKGTAAELRDAVTAPSETLNDKLSPPAPHAKAVYERTQASLASESRQTTAKPKKLDTIKESVKVNILVRLLSDINRT